MKPQEATWVCPSEGGVEVFCGSVFGVSVSNGNERCCKPAGSCYPVPQVGSPGPVTPAGGAGSFSGFWKSFQLLRELPTSHEGDGINEPLVHSSAAGALEETVTAARDPRRARCL